MILVLMALCGACALLGVLAFLSTQGGQAEAGNSKPGSGTGAGETGATDTAATAGTTISGSGGTDTTGSGDTTGGGSGSSGGSGGGGEWRGATLTCFREDRNFAYGGTDPSKHNVVAVLQKDFNDYKGKKLQLKLPTGVHTVEVRDLCAASAPECSRNAAAHGTGFLIDINNHALERVWRGKSCDSTFQKVQWRPA